MCGLLLTPSLTKVNDFGQGNGVRYAVSSMQGWREEMEDSHCARPIVGSEFTNISFFGVFDGHSGESVAQYCANKLLVQIIANECFEIGRFIQGIKAGFLELDKQMSDMPPDQINGGTTASCVLISPTHFYFANCGDSRALISRNHRVFFASQDHKPFLPNEERRIRQAGGFIKMGRVNGILAVSRALGDFQFKKAACLKPAEQAVSPEPDVVSIVRNDDDDFIVLACDGVWDVISNEDLCDFVYSRLQITDDLVEIANNLVDTCFYKGSHDNISVVIITFDSSPQPNEDAIAAELQADKELEDLARSILQSREVTHVTELFDALCLKELPVLPPGGGLYAKYYLLQKIFDEHMQKTNGVGGAQAS